MSCTFAQVFGLVCIEINTNDRGVTHCQRAMKKPDPLYNWYSIFKAISNRDFPAVSVEQPNPFFVKESTDIFQWCWCSDKKTIIISRSCSIFLEHNYNF